MCETNKLWTNCSESEADLLAKLKRSTEIGIHNEGRWRVRAQYKRRFPLPNARCCCIMSVLSPLEKNYQFPLRIMGTIHAEAMFDRAGHVVDNHVRAGGGTQGLSARSQVGAALWPCVSLFAGRLDRVAHRGQAV